MKALLDGGFSISSGVLNVLDSDFQNAEDLHIATVAEAPFAPIGERAHAENLKLLLDSSAVIVSSFPVGPGNLKNLEAAMTARTAGKSVFILSPEAGKGIDFVGGKANAAVKELIRSGAIQVDSIEDLLGRLSRGGGG